jgi:hypothetical protein
MRGGTILCERDCKNQELDYNFKDAFLSSTKGPALETPWGEGTFSDSGYKFSTGQGLQLSEGRCIKGSAYTLYMMASLDTTSGWKRLIGSGNWGDNGIFVNKQFQTFPVSFLIIFFPLFIIFNWFCSFDAGAEGPKVQ